MFRLRSTEDGEEQRTAASDEEYEEEEAEPPRRVAPRRSHEQKMQKGRKEDSILISPSLALHLLSIPLERGHAHKKNSDNELR